ncbi:purine/pyrimidine permease [Desulfosarcina sp. OttesenSCG-928-A07]|nr:purine/pyrimidine permease [Desulfosarcina sp. OttesenSCG-928-G17]MDL2329290.1 purine/pyrimidine permease [Desulfosarcina sp. OttesenSCG-928-A07]
MKYQLDDKPGIGAMVLYGLQWWVVSLPCVVIMGVVVARLHYTDIGAQTFYLQKLFGVMGTATLVQIFMGHRLPLVVGPAATLLVGIVAATASSINAVYTAILAGGAILAVIGYSGLMTRLRFFFTPRIIAVILILIAFTLCPTILKLVFPGPDHAIFHLCFALTTVGVLILWNTWAPGVWKSMTVIIGIAGGTLVYLLVLGTPSLGTAGADPESYFLFLPRLEFHMGTLFSFVFCFLALIINELGSIESVGHMLKADTMAPRIRSGMGLQGLANMAAGGLGVIGPVDFSLSAGVIAATGCASRFTLAPAGVGLVLCAFIPQLVLLLSHIPSPVMGALMLYLMSAQLASGLAMLVSEKGVTDFNSGITVSLPLMVGILISFAPPEVMSRFPELIRPIIGNGFAMGTLTVVILEHIVFRKGKEN